jgi:hypothetical protein
MPTKALRIVDDLEMMGLRDGFFRATLGGVEHVWR